MSVVDLVSEAQKSHSVIQFIPAIVVNAVLGDTPSPLLVQVSHFFEEEKWQKQCSLGIDHCRAEEQARGAAFFP